MKSLLTRLFGRKKQTSLKGISTINDLFSHTLKHLPDTSFEKHQPRVVDGKFCSIYIKGLKKPELGIFDEIEVRTPREFENKTVCFIVNDLNNLDFEKLKFFVNTCYSIYGADDSDIQKGKFTDEDMGAIIKRTWKGRVWDNRNPSLQIVLTEGRIVVSIRS